MPKLNILPFPDKLDCALNQEYSCLLTDDGSNLTVKLAQSLTQQGWKVVILKFPQSIITEKLSLPKGINSITLSDMSEQHLKETLESINQSYGSICAFIHLNPPTLTAKTAKAILKQVFLIAKYLQKSLNETAKKARSWFITVTHLDGKLGLGNKQIDQTITGGFFGLTKTLNLEWEKVFCRAIDLSPSLDTETSVKAIMAELYDPNLLVSEVGYDSQTRVTIVAKNYPELAPIITTNHQITEDSVFIVSGGARGITAKCIIKLAQFCPCKFILLGRSKLIEEPEWAKNCCDEIELKKIAFFREKKLNIQEINRLIKNILASREIKETLQAIEKLGGQAEYLSVDLTNNFNLQEKLTILVTKFGQITGIIHGAGVLADKLIENKSEQDFERVYSTKIEGLQSLLNCLKPDQLKHLILFSSAAGFYGNIGQSDYAIANEILNKFAYQFKRSYPDCQVITFNWGPWESGMVTPELKQLFAQRGIEVIPVEVGTQVFINELIAKNLDTIQILVGSSLVNSSVSLKSDLKTYQIKRKLTLEANPFLQDHVIGNHPVLPIVFALNWLAITSEQLYPGYKFFSCEKYQVFKGIVFDDTLASKYILELKEINKVPEQEIELSATIWSKVKQGKTCYHYQSKIKLLKQIPKALNYDKFDKEQDDKLINISPYQDGTLFHGSNFQGIKRILNISPQKMTMEYILPKVKENYWGQFPPQSFNPLAADIPFQCMLIWVRYFYKAGSLPLLCQRGEHFQSIPWDENFYVSMEVQSSSDTKLVADLITHDKQGKVYAKVLGAEVIISKQLNQLFAGGKIN